jgi:hypothetical protein
MTALKTMAGSPGGKSPSRRTLGILACIFLALVVSATCVSGQQTRPGAQHERERTRTVYVIQTYYHTGFIIELDRETRSLLEFTKRFDRFRYIDIGWGEAVFYQDPAFTLCKGARAILLPSKSVVRVEGFNQDIRDVIAMSDRAMKFSMTRGQFARLCSFINGSIRRDRERGLIVASVHENGEIIFYKSPRTYCLFNTCNTWIANGLRYAGLDISPAFVVTAKSLFWKLDGEGDVLKKSR